MIKQLSRKTDFGRAVHLGLDDVNAAGAAVANRLATGQLAVTLEIMHGDGGGDHCIQDALWNLTLFAVCSFIENGRVGHQMAHVAQEHQRATMHANLAAIGSGV